MLNKDDKDGIIEFLKQTLTDVKEILAGVDQYDAVVCCDKIEHALIDVTW